MAVLIFDILIDTRGYVKVEDGKSEVSTIYIVV
jgi:hypothetical protein